MARSRSAATDVPPLKAGRWHWFSLVAGGWFAVATFGVWGGIASSGLLVDWLSAVFLAGAAGGLAGLWADALVNRLRSVGEVVSLQLGRPSEWAEVARTESRQHAERAAAIADGVGDPYLSTQRYVAEYFRRANAWVGETNRRLQGRFTLVAIVAVCGVLAAVCGMTPERAKEQSFMALGWPAVLAAVLATVAGMEVLARGRRWERLFATWREWATDNETPDLPPPSPAVEMVKPPPAKKSPPPPPPVVELVAQPPPPKPAPPPPKAEPSAFERLKSLDLNPSPDDDNDRK